MKTGNANVPNAFTASSWRCEILFTSVIAAHGGTTSWCMVPRWWDQLVEGEGGHMLRLLSLPVQSTQCAWSSFTFAFTAKNVTQKRSSEAFDPDQSFGLMCQILFTIFFSNVLYVSYTKLQFFAKTTFWFLIDPNQIHWCKQRQTQFSWSTLKSGLTTLEVARARV